ncbi:MAG: hypothetical protein II565_04580, partial [Fibrobacter sp.]|nr:hypothetical protein [Fibrobacter sp.]
KDILAGSIKLTVIPFTVPETKGNFEVIRTAMREGFGIFHVEGDEAVFEDVKSYLKFKGATV